MLAGSQSRIHAEHMVEQIRLADEKARFFKERRDAYLDLLRWIDLASKRTEYVAQDESRRTVAMRPLSTASQSVVRCLRASV
ncbi:hypothetical protein SAMN06265355_106392 [Actinomadura mexicana]|uniref:Uncharacterized protein n=1 Tax=Actinomadura mexicana TaxID=134959 RepID=A0A238Z0S3_9ACTN|nr:hypothetical protein SAMN06265355_106392 [Actinomadura mexicana]